MENWGRSRNGTTTTTTTTTTTKNSIQNLCFNIQGFFFWTLITL